MAAPAPFHLQKLCVFLAFSKRVAPERPSIANVLTLFCWWFWSGRETWLVFVEQLVKTDPFAQVQGCISELSWKSFHCALKLFFFFFSLWLCMPTWWEIEENSFCFPRRKIISNSFIKKREKMGIYVCHNVHKHLCHYCAERKLTLCGKTKVSIRVKRQWNYRWFIELRQFWELARLTLVTLESSFLPSSYSSIFFQV